MPRECSTVSLSASSARCKWTVCSFKAMSRVLAGFTDGRADEGVGAGEATLVDRWTGHLLERAESLGGQIEFMRGRAGGAP